MGKGLALLFVLLGISVFASDRPYPPHFLWGAAFSAHQTEGAFGGGENGDWYEFENPPAGVKSPIENGDTANVSVDHWNRYEEDFAIARSIGINTIRTSIAWEKVEPRQGEYNAEALAHYKKRFSRMKDMGMRPMISFHHFTHPKWFHEKGGWLDPESPKWFTAYARRVVEELKDSCDLWMTFNEPMMLVVMGYLKGGVPPQKHSVEESFEVAYNMARANRMVTAMIHELQPMPANKKPALKGVGVAYGFSYFEPADPKRKKDREAVDVMHDLSNWAWLNSLESGEIEFKIPKEVYKPKFKLKRKFPADDVPAGQNHRMDWMGVNYYAMYQLRYDKNNSLKINWITPPGEQGDNGWVIYPQGLGNLLAEVDRRYDYPMVVSESGLADAADSRRPQHIRDHLAQVDAAIAKGSDIRGYYHWSLMDNFEWTSGYKYRFGLVEIDFADGLKRKPRPSARVYADEIRIRSPH